MTAILSLLQYVQAEWPHIHRVDNLVIIGLDNTLSPLRRNAITQTTQRKFNKIMHKIKVVDTEDAYWHYHLRQTLCLEGDKNLSGC